MIKSLTSFGIVILFISHFAVVAQTSISGVINNYTVVTAVGNSGCSDSVTVNSTTGFAVGDSVLIIQMQGASIDTTNTSLFGTVTNFSNSGNYEYLRILSITGTTIRFTSALIRQYSVANKVQLVTKPVYANAVVNGILSAQPWNGSTGGVLTFSVGGNLALNSDIDVTGKGFRGGVPSTNYYSTYYNAYCFGASPGRGGKKGESIAEYISNKEYGRAPHAGGGGGGNDVNTAGGGGGNYGSGGHGGYYAIAPDTLWGMRGKSLSTGINQHKLFLGSGGGGGHQNNSEGTAGSNGGGSIFLYANTITGNSHFIKANGSNVIDTAGIDGAGGGGAGGSILMDAQTFTSLLSVEAKGGKGGDQFYIPQCHGNGGGGGGGVIVFTGAALPANVTTSVAGGAKGLGQCNNTPTDGIPGSAGLLINDWQTIQNAQLLTSTDITCHGSNNGSASVAVSGNPPYQFLWTTPGGSTMTTSSISNLTPGNYSLRVTNGSGCQSNQSFIILEPSQIQINVTSVNVGCNGSPGSATANVTGGVGAYSYLWNTTPVQTTQSATNLSANNYTVTAHDGNNCIATNSVTILSSPVSFSIHSTPATCLDESGTVTVTHTGGVGPFSYHWTPPYDTTDASIGHAAAGGYSVVATDLGSGCSQSLSVIVGNTSGITVTIASTTDATCENDDDGSATVAASGGQAPYYYLWLNGDTTATTDHLSPGTYLARVEDYNGCPAFAYATIGFDFLSPVIDLGPDTMPCLGVPYMMDAGSGFINYLWSDNSTNQTLTVSSSGTYSVVVTNVNGCQNSDAVQATFITCISTEAAEVRDIANAVVVYPNPFGEELFVSVKNKSGSRVRISLSDILGNELLAPVESGNSDFRASVDVQSLSAGIYFLTVDLGGERIVKLISKQ